MPAVDIRQCGAKDLPANAFAPTGHWKTEDMGVCHMILMGHMVGRMTILGPTLHIKDMDNPCLQFLQGNFFLQLRNIKTGVTLHDF